MKYKKNEAKHKADREPTAKDNLMKDYRVGVIASLKARWWLYILILIAAVFLTGFSQSSTPLWLIAPLLGGLLIGFVIIKDNIKTIKMIRAEAKKKSRLTGPQRIILLVVVFISSFVLTFILFAAIDAP